MPEPMAMIGSRNIKQDRCLDKWWQKDKAKLGKEKVKINTRQTSEEIMTESGDSLKKRWWMTLQMDGAIGTKRQV